jgi:hypothetical protein
MVQERVRAKWFVEAVSPRAFARTMLNFPVVVSGASLVQHELHPLRVHRGPSPRHVPEPGPVLTRLCPGR